MSRSCVCGLQDSGDVLAVIGREISSPSLSILSHANSFPGSCMRGSKFTMLSQIWMTLYTERLAKFHRIEEEKDKTLMSIGKNQDALKQHVLLSPN